MFADISALLILQNRDQRLLSVSKDLEKIPLDVARIKAKWQADQKSVAEALDQLRLAELTVKKIELDVQTRRTTIQRLKTQQFETRKNEEFNALKHEVERYEKEVDNLENQELEAMEVVDAKKAAHTLAEENLAKFKILIEGELALMKERKINLDQTHAELLEERAALAQKAPQDWLPLYQKLLKSKNGLAIVPLNDGQCGGCSLKVITSVAVAVHAQNAVVQCNDCGRILYAAE